jgi:WD40 repeat protein
MYQGFVSGLASLCIVSAVLANVSGAALAQGTRQIDVIPRVRHSESVHAISFSSDGLRTITASGDGTVKLWAVPSGRLIRTLAGASSIISIHATATNEKLITGHDNGDVRIWDILTGRLVRTLKGHSGYVTSVAASPDASRVFSGGADKTIRIWDASDGHTIHVLTGHTQQVDALVVIKNGEQLISADRDHELIVWDVNKGGLRRFGAVRPNQSCTMHDSTCYPNVALRASPDGRYMALRSEKILEIWEISSGRLLHDLVANLPDTKEVTAFTFSVDGKRLTALVDGILHLWDVEHGTYLGNIKLQEHRSKSQASLSPDGSFLVFAEFEPTIIDALTGDVLSENSGYLTPAVIYGLAATDDGTRLVSGGWDGMTRVWDLATGGLKQILKPGGNVNAVAIASGGTTVMSGSSNGLISHSLHDGHPVAPMVEDIGQVLAIAYSPDGERIAVASGNGEVFVLKPTTG